MPAPHFRTLVGRSLLALVLASAAGLGTAAAQATEGSPPADNAARAAAPLSPGEIAAMLDSYAAVRAREALSLDEAHYTAFVARLRRLHEVRHSNQQRHNQLLQELRRLAGAQAEPPYDEAAIRERLKALREEDDRAALELHRAYEAVDEVLDPRQQARFRLFEETIERRKLDLVMRAREGAARKRNIQP
jgi:Spy/CpxP family protein refolding chaperone